MAGIKHCWWELMEMAGVVTAVGGVLVLNEFLRNHSIVGQIVGLSVK